MKNREFKKLIDRKGSNKVKEEYMLGKHSSLTDRQLRIVCEKDGTGRGAVAFTYRKKNKDGKEN